MSVNANDKTVDAQNLFTEYLTVPGKGSIDVIDTSSGNMTLTLQVLPFGQSTPIDVDSITAAGRYEFEGLGGSFRFGCKTGDYSSGTFDVVLSAPKA
jgi:hypothetical protein